MGAMIIVMSIARPALVRFKETPKFLLGQGKDSEVVENLNQLAEQYHRSCPITLQQLEDCGTITTAHSQSSQFSFSLDPFARSVLNEETRPLDGPPLAFLVNARFRISIVQRVSAIVPGQPGSQVRCDQYLRDVEKLYALAQVCSILRPIISAYLANRLFLGRRYTMAMGGLLTSTFLFHQCNFLLTWPWLTPSQWQFLFAYYQVTSPQQKVAYTCVISFALQIYATCLYGYIVEVLPSAHRATGNGISLAVHGFMGAMSAIITTKANTDTAAPVFICAALYGGLAVLLPFEPCGKRAS